MSKNDEWCVDEFASACADSLKGLLNAVYGVPEPQFAIERVLFNPPATIVFWDDGAKTVVKAQNGEFFDKEKGLAMAICKRLYGNRANYFNIFKTWCYEKEGNKQ